MALRWKFGEGFTRLFRGATGRLEKRPFVVMGRVRYSFGSGFWDEWFLEFGDGTIGWLTEDNHELALQTRTTSKKIPQNIKCGSCGAGLTVKDEQSQMVVCEYCGSQLDVSATAQTVLGKGLANKPYFPLELGDAFHHKATRFEVISRLAFIEDHDISEMTKEYLLYNPRRGSLWRGEYGGHYSISHSSHGRPTKVAFDVSRGDVIKTHDGNQWVAEGKGTYALHYVDGALPWITRVGDRLQYAEFAEKSGSGKRYIQLMVIALAAAVLNGLLAFYCYQSGTVVLKQGFLPQEITNGAMSRSFIVRGKGKITKITVSAPLDNAWMSLEAAIVRRDGKVVHLYERSLEYYHGRSGGESWSEGSRSNSELVKIPDPGLYKLFVQAVSAQGNASRATRALHGLQVEIKDRALPGGKFALVGGLCLALFILTAEAIEDMANNPNAGANAMGMIAGVGMGNIMGGAMQGAAQPPAGNQVAAQPAAGPPPLPNQSQWYAGLDNQQAGPFTPDQIRQLIGEGRIARETLVWKQGMADWTQAVQTAEIKEYFGATPPPLPK
jgi:hypothetical protein